jgi:hypothetical protein
MPILRDIQGTNWPRPDAKALADALAQLENPTMDRASATLTVDTGEFITVRPSREVTFGSRDQEPCTIHLATWEDALTLWSSLLAGDLEAVRAVFAHPGPPQPAPTCPLCNTPMAIGFIPDFARNGPQTPIWYPGAAQIGFLGFVKRPNEAYYRVTAFRCPSCGRVELYAFHKA